MKNKGFILIISLFSLCLIAGNDSEAFLDNQMSLHDSLIFEIARVTEYLSVLNPHHREKMLHLLEDKIMQLLYESPEVHGPFLYKLAHHFPEIEPYIRNTIQAFCLNQNQDQTLIPIEFDSVTECLQAFQKALPTNSHSLEYCFLCWQIASQLPVHLFDDPQSEYPIPCLYSLLFTIALNYQTFPILILWAHNNQLPFGYFNKNSPTSYKDLLYTAVHNNNQSLSLLFIYYDRYHKLNRLDPATRYDILQKLIDKDWFYTFQEFVIEEDFNLENEVKESLLFYVLNHQDPTLKLKFMQYCLPLASKESINKRNFFGQTLLQIAIMGDLCPALDAPPFFPDFDIINLILAHGADINILLPESENHISLIEWIDNKIEGLFQSLDDFDNPEATHTQQLIEIYQRIRSRIIKKFPRNERKRFTQIIEPFSNYTLNPC